MLYRDATGKIIVINRCDYKNDQLYYKQLTALKNDIHKQFSNTPKYDEKIIENNQVNTLKYFAKIDF